MCETLLAQALSWLADEERAARSSRAGRGWRRRLVLGRRARPAVRRRRRGRCPVCVELARAERDYVGALVTGLGDPELDAAYAASDGLCLPHVELALVQADGTPGTARLLARTRERVARLADDLRRFIDKHDHRTRAAFTEREARSWAAAVALLAGRAERFGSDMG